MNDDVADLQLRPVSELLGERFFVPSYQRGYRWTAKQVKDLLDDLYAFLRTEPPRDSYYCLQPVVVRRREDDSWELVDGQQRLTTIHLLLGCLADVARMLGKKPFELRYQTREGSEAFLRDPTPGEAATNIDYHHMYGARAAILEWFGQHDGAVRLDMLKVLTQPSDNGANVRVIWYELAAEQDPRAVFIRLNVGRIPLTSAELIRALFLRTDGHKAEPRQQQLAQEWDLIEKRLHDPSYWYFLQSDRHDPPTRIEYLFDVFCHRSPTEHIEQLEQVDPLATFFAFQRSLNGENPFEVWREFRKDIAQTLEEWFEDRVLYHLVGTLIAVSADSRRASARLLVELLRERDGQTGTAFERHLRQRLWRCFLGKHDAKLPSDQQELEGRLDERIDKLRYSGGAGRLRTALLLFNVAGLLESRESTQRLRFDAFANNTWDIEHIRSVAEYIPASPKHRKSWLVHARKFVEHSGDEPLLAKVVALLAATAPEQAAFELVFRRVRALSGEDQAGDDGDELSNLALLDMGTNRSYKNAIFPVKRERIIALDREGVYVPPATRNVFLKYYTPQAGQLLRWSAEDQAAYGDAQRKTLLGFFQSIVSASGPTGIEGTK